MASTRDCVHAPHGDNPPPRPHAVIAQGVVTENYVPQPTKPVDPNPVVIDEPGQGATDGTAPDTHDTPNVYQEPAPAPKRKDKKK